MTPRINSMASKPLRFAQKSGRGSWLASSIFFAFGSTQVGCGGQATEPINSTDTGNPPVIAETKLRVVAGEDGVVVSGGKGAVSPGADVEVTNLSTDGSAETTAASDGSFEVEVEGGLDDGYRVEAKLNGKSVDVELAPTNTDAELDEHDFQLESSEGYEPVTGTSMNLSFSEGDIRLNAGCNTLAGPYSLCDGNLCVSELSTTDIGCDQALHAQDEWLADFITSTPSVDYAPPRITLASDGVTLTFLDAEQADPDRTLTERVWNFDTQISNGSASNLPLTNPATIEFNDDGTFVGFDSCNSMSGTYVADPSTLTFSDVSSTERKCDTDVAFQAYFKQFFQAGSCSYSIDANRLTLMQAEIGLSATTE
jgi:heat shock protein HslJ